MDIYDAAHRIEFWQHSDPKSKALVIVIASSCIGLAERALSL